MDDHSRWKETEEIYSILLTRGEDIEWRTSLESLHFQNLYLEKGFSLPLQEINALRKSTIVRVLNSLVKKGENFLSFYSFTERTNRDVWRRIVNWYGTRLPAHRGYPWRPREHSDSDPRELLCSLWRVWRGLTVDHENQHAETRLLDESTHEPTQNARLAAAATPVEETKGVRFISEYELSPDTPYVFKIASAVASPFDMSEPDIDNVLMTLQSPLEVSLEDRDAQISLEDLRTIINLLRLFRSIFYTRTLQVGLDRASSEYHRLGGWKRLVRPALAETEYLITQGYVEEWSMKVDGFGNMESVMRSDFMAAFWAHEEFRLCDSVLVQDPDTLLFRRDLELEIQCNAPLLDWDASEGPLQIVINTRFNIPEESLRESKVLVSSARPAFIRLLAKTEGEQDMPSQFRLSTGLVDLSQGVLPTGGSQALYHLVAEICQKRDGKWGKIRILDDDQDDDVSMFYERDPSTLRILIYALFDAGSMPYPSQRRYSAVPEQKESSDTIGHSSVPSVFGSDTPTSSVFPTTPNPSVAAPVIPGRQPPPNVEASAKRAGTRASECPNKNQKRGNRGGRRRRG